MTNSADINISINSNEYNDGFIQKILKPIMDHFEVALNRKLLDESNKENVIQPKETFFQHIPNGRVGGLIYESPLTKNVKSRDMVSTNEVSWADDDWSAECDRFSDCCDCCSRREKSQCFPDKNCVRDNTIDSIEAEINENEINNMKQEVDTYRKRIKCLSEMNHQLQAELSESIRNNFLLEQCVTCPYIVSKGKVKFPGKNDLDERFDCMFKTLEDIEKDLVIAQNDNYLAQKLDRVLNLSLRRCPNCS